MRSKDSHGQRQARATIQLIRSRHIWQDILEYDDKLRELKRSKDKIVQQKRIIQALTRKK
jgi:hypothetical protein